MISCQRRNAVLKEVGSGDFNSTHVHTVVDGFHILFLYNNLLKIIDTMQNLHKWHRMGRKYMFSGIFIIEICLGGKFLKHDF